MKLRSWFWLGLLGALAGCVSNTITLESETDEGTGTPPPSTSTSTTASSVTVSTSAAVTSAAVTTTPPPPPVTSAVTTDEPVLDVGFMDTTSGIECDPPCSPDHICIEGLCFEDPDLTTGDECGYIADWEDCSDGMGGVDDALCTGPGMLCLSENPVQPEFAVCAAMGCNDACDCPLAPPTTEANVVCEDITGKGQGTCFLECSSGQTCPPGMTCAFDFICMYEAS
ncbi:MAG: hypothetical protein AAF799_03695 [Myxococcota bacterium]